MPRKNKTRKNKKRKTGGGIESSKHKLAIIIPYRNREQNLEIISKFLNIFLDINKIDNDIFVIEQNDNNSFNRGKLSNIGFDICNNIGIYDYFIFHDVDELPIQVDYSYSDVPLTLFSHDPNKFDSKHYGSPTGMHDSRLTTSEFNMGGCILFTQDNFEKINGYSNLYSGWGAEDDDLANRVKHVFQKITRRDGIYFALPHVKENFTKSFRTGPNIDYKNNIKLLENSVENMFSDGLNTLSYRISSIDHTPFYRHYKVNI